MDKPKFSISELAWRNDTPSEVLADLATSPDTQTRRGVAWNPNTSASVLTILADDEPEVKYCVAMNINTPPETLRHLLIKNKTWGIIGGVAMNKNSPQDLLIEMACTPEYRYECCDIHNLLMKNPNTPEPVKMWLRNDGFAGMTLEEFLEKMKEE